MKLLKLFYCTLLFSIVLACSSSKPVSNTKNSVKRIEPTSQEYLFRQQPDKFYFTILQLNDVYEIAPIQGGKFGGMARVEAVHQQLLKENPNTMLVLAGDFLNPSLLGTMKVDGDRVRGKQMVEVMNAMNFDVVAFGNHEFDLSLEQLQDRLNESQFAWVSSNVYQNINGQSHYFHKVVNGKKHSVNDSYIHEFYENGKSVKVGLISACINSNPRNYVSYSDPFREIERSYNEIKDQVDIVIGLTHLDIEEDRKVAEMLPNLPLIMGGHEHTNNYEDIGGVKIAKADANAKTVYIHRFELDTNTKQINLKSELRPIDDNLPEDTIVGEIVAKWQKVLDTKIKEVVENPYEVIYNAAVPLDARDTPVRSIQTNMGEVITKSMSYAYNNDVDCALLNGGSIRIDDVLKGKVTVVDIFRVLPYGGPILKVKIKGDLLLQVLDYGEQASGTGAYLQRYNVAKDTSGQWLISNTIIDSSKVYTVAFSDYLLKGFDIPFLKESNPGVLNIYTPKTTEISVDVRKAVVQYLKNQKNKK